MITQTTDKTIMEGKTMNWKLNKRKDMVLDENDLDVADVFSGKNDAQLIAAAPDLLEALKIAIVDSEQKLTLADRKQRAKYYHQAITKAEGK